MPKSEIFISYAWGGESEEIANALESTFQKKGIKIVRDKTDLNYKGLIREFMQQIGEGKCVITVISDKYLKSKNCMFELMEIANNNNFYDRIFSIVLKDAQIYDVIERLQYIKYWDEKVEKLNEAMKGVKELTNLQGITDEINLYRNIRNEIAKLTDILQNMNTLTVEMHREEDFGEIIAAIEKRLNSEAQETLKQPIPNAGVEQPAKNDVNPALKTWKERLAYLQNQEAITANPAQKFELSKQIEECQQKIKELGE